MVSLSKFLISKSDDLDNFPLLPHRLNNHELYFQCNFEIVKIGFALILYTVLGSDSRKKTWRGKTWDTVVNHYKSYHI